MVTIALIVGVASVVSLAVSVFGPPKGRTVSE
jgi:hypothetical protein